MTDESLIEKWYSLLSIVVPQLYEVVFTTSEHVASIFGKVSSFASTSMHCIQISEMHAFEAGKTVHSDTLVFCDDDDLAIVLSELEAANDCTNRDLMLKDNGVGAVDHQVVSVFAHDSE